MACHIRTRNDCLRTPGSLADAPRSENFYGFIGAEENNFEPSLHDGVTNIEVPETEGYHLIGGVRQSPFNGQLQTETIDLK